MGKSSFSSIQSFISKRAKLFRWILGITFFAAIVLGLFMKKQSNCLTTPHAPKGIVSLQLAESAKEAELIKKEWRGPCSDSTYYRSLSFFNKRKHIDEYECGSCDLTKEAVTQTKLDWLFIILYTLLFISLGVVTFNGILVDKLKNWWTLIGIISVPILAGVMDIVENFFILQFLECNLSSSKRLYFFLPAVIKFSTLILLTITYLISWFFHPKAKAMVYAIRLYFPEILVLAILLTGLGLSQGQDIINEMVEKQVRMFVGILASIYLSFILWYTARLKTYIVRKVRGNEAIELDEPVDSLMRMGYNKREAILLRARIFFFHYFPRILPWLTFLILQVVILNNPVFDPSLFVKLTIYGANIGVLFLYKYPSDEFLEIFKKNFRVSYALITFIPILLASLTFTVGDPSLENTNLWAAYDLKFTQLIILMILCSIYFVFLVRIRRLLLDQTDIKWEGVIGKPAHEKWFSRFLDVSSAIAAPFFLLVAVFPGFSSFTTALPMLFIALAVLVGLSNLISVRSINDKINYQLLAVILLVFLSMVTDHYEIRTTPQSNSKNGYQSRPSVDKFYGQFVNRLDSSKKKRFPLFFVLSDGGATRSSYWVTTNLGYVMDKDCRFKDHLFSLSGASGGSVGNAAFYAYMAKYNQQGNYQKNLDTLLQKDFLTHALAKMLSTDIIQYAFPFLNIDDRAEGVERMFEFYDKKSGLNIYNQPFSHFINSNNDRTLPILTMNTTRVQDGRPGLISTVLVEGTFTDRIDLLSLLSDSSDFQYDLNYSTAMILSSRFPYVSPAGNVRNHHFADGGYFDNSGAGPTKQLLHALDNIGAQACFEYYIIHLTNSPTIPRNQLKPINSLVNDLSAPLLTLANSYNKQTSLNNTELKDYLKRNYADDWKKHWISIDLYDTSKIDTAYSFSWSMSAHTKKRMKNRHESRAIQRQLDRVSLVIDEYRNTTKSKAKTTCLNP